MIAMKISSTIFAMSSSSGNGSTISGFYHASNGHSCTHENSVLRTSLKAGNFARGFLGCSQFKVSNNAMF